jgi:glycerol uptake facilitator-like aquaporin
MFSSDLNVEVRENRSDSTDSSSTGEIFIEKVREAEERQLKALEKIEKSIDDKVKKDNSKEAKQRRRNMAIRAAYGEFMATFLFFTPIFGCIANVAEQDQVNLPNLSSFVAGFQAIAVCFAFSSVSGAHLNPAISWALWYVFHYSIDICDIKYITLYCLSRLTGKLSNRKTMAYIAVQFLASIVSMCVVATMFNNHSTSNIYDACSVVPRDINNKGQIFATEFFLTFILTFVAFTVVFEDAETSKKETMSFQTLSDSKGLTLYASTPQRYSNSFFYWSDNRNRH